MTSESKLGSVISELEPYHGWVPPGDELGWIDSTSTNTSTTGSTSSCLQPGRRGLHETFKIDFKFIMMDI